MVSASGAADSTSPGWTLDIKPLASMLAVYDVDYVVAGTFAAAPQRLLDPDASEPLQLLVAGEEENLEAMADALFALQAHLPGGAHGDWRPWPATPGHLEGLVDTIAGRLRISVVGCLSDQADTWDVEIGGQPVRLEMEGQPRQGRSPGDDRGLDGDEVGLRDLDRPPPPSPSSPTGQP